MDFEHALEEYNKKLKEEFTFDPKDTSAVDVSRKVRDSLIPAQPMFITGLVQLAKSAKSESVRLQAIKFGIEAVFGRNVVTEEESSFNKLLSELRDDKEESKK